jgi:hypothetical protein
MGGTRRYYGGGGKSGSGGGDGGSGGGGETAARICCAKESPDPGGYSSRSPVHAHGRLRPEPSQVMAKAYAIGDAPEASLGPARNDRACCVKLLVAWARQSVTGCHLSALLLAFPRLPKAIGREVREMNPGETVNGKVLAGDRGVDEGWGRSVRGSRRVAGGELRSRCDGIAARVRGRRVTEFELAGREVVSQSLGQARRGVPGVVRRHGGRLGVTWRPRCRCRDLCRTATARRRDPGQREATVEPARR